MFILEYMTDFWLLFITAISFLVNRKSILFQVCGPTISKDCKQFTGYGGLCFTLDSNNRPSGPIPSTLRGTLYVELKQKKI